MACARAAKHYAALGNGTRASAARRHGSALVSTKRAFQPGSPVVAHGFRRFFAQEGTTARARTLRMDSGGRVSRPCLRGFSSSIDHHAHPARVLDARYRPRSSQAPAFVAVGFPVAPSRRPNESLGGRASGPTARSREGRTYQRSQQPLGDYKQRRRDGNRIAPPFSVLVRPLTHFVFARSLMHVVRSALGRPRSSRSAQRCTLLAVYRERSAQPRRAPRSAARSTARPSCSLRGAGRRRACRRSCRVSVLRKSRVGSSYPASESTGTSRHSTTSCFLDFDFECNVLCPFRVFSCCGALRRSWTFRQ